jgi:putative lipoprotein (rSAM/lipoprotein system)
MKKIKHSFFKSFNAVLVALMGVFGFSGCEGKLMYGTPTPEYGTPYSKFIIKGAVINDADKEPIEGIQVKIIGTFTGADNEEHTVYLKPKKLTDEDGSFELRTHSLGEFLASDILSASIHFSDIDGVENGLFENKAIELNPEDFEQTRPPGGNWFMGEFTKNLDTVQLTPKEEEEENQEENDE